MNTTLTVTEILNQNEDQNSRACNFMVNNHFKEAFEIFDVMAGIEDRERPEFFNESRMRAEKCRAKLLEEFYS